MFPRMHDSPMPMKTTSGLDSETATAPTDELWICPSVTGNHVSPPLVVFQRPPPVAPKYASRGRPLTPEIAMDRQPRSGPMLRHEKDFRMSDSTEDDVAAAELCERTAARSKTPASANGRATTSVVRSRRDLARSMSKLLQWLQEFT